jgi:hypothetical protein
VNTVLFAKYISTLKMPPKKRKAASTAKDDFYYYDDDEEQQPQKQQLTLTIPNHQALTNASTNTGFMNSAGVFVGSSIPSESMLDGTSGFLDLSTSLTLKPDHEKRPIWVTTNNVIILVGR